MYMMSSVCRLVNRKLLLSVVLIVVVAVATAAIVLNSILKPYKTSRQSYTIKPNTSTSFSDFSVKQIGNVVIVPSEVLSRPGIVDKLIEYYLKGYVILILGPNIDLSLVKKFINILTIKPIQIHLSSGKSVRKVISCEKSTNNKPVVACVIKYSNTVVYSKHIAKITYRLPECTIALAIANVHGKTAVAEYEAVNILTRKCVVLPRWFVEKYLLSNIINDVKKFIKRVRRDLETYAKSEAYFEIKYEEGGNIIGFRKFAWYYLDPCGHVLGYGDVYLKLFYVAKDRSTGKLLFVVYAASKVTDYERKYECNGIDYGSIMFKNITIIRDALAEEYPDQFVGKSGPTEQADCPGGILSYSFTLSEEPSFTITIAHSYGGSTDYAVATKWVVSRPSCLECVVNEFVACKPEKYKGRTGYGDTLVEVIGYEPVYAKVKVEQWIELEVKPSWWPFGYFTRTLGPYKTTCTLKLYHNKAIVSCKFS